VVRTADCRSVNRGSIPLCSAKRIMELYKLEIKVTQRSDDICDLIMDLLKNRFKAKEPDAEKEKRIDQLEIYFYSKEIISDIRHENIVCTTKNELKKKYYLQDKDIEIWLQHEGYDDIFEEKDIQIKLNIGELS
jgi:hypothetical protein